MEILLITLSLCIIVLTVSVSYFLFYSSKVMKAIVKYCDTKDNEILVKIAELYKEIINIYGPHKNQADQRSKRNESTGLFQTPYADYWYLREGDFRPERIKEFNGGYFSARHIIPLLKEAGNLFPTKEAAAIASEKVREFLLSINSQQCT